MGWARTSTRLESERRSDHLRFRSYGRVWAWTDIWEEQEEKDMRGTYGGRPRFASPTIPTVGCTLASRRAYDLAGFLKTTLCFRRKHRRIDVCRLWHSHLAFCSLQPLPRYHVAMFAKHPHPSPNTDHSPQCQDAEFCLTCRKYEHLANQRETTAASSPDFFLTFFRAKFGG